MSLKIFMIIIILYASMIFDNLPRHTQQQLCIEDEAVQAPIMEVGSGGGGGGGDYNRHRAAVSGPIQEQGEGKEKAMWV